MATPRVEDLIPTSASVATPRAPRTSGIARFFYGLSLLAAIVGTVVGLGGAVAANGAPQEAAAAAIGCVIIIAPYVFARGVDAMTRGD